VTLTGIDVLRTVAEALRHPQDKAGSIRIKRHRPVDTITTARMELDPETADRGTVAQRLVEGIATQWPRRDVE
jgi:hypothetical protein